MKRHGICCAAAIIGVIQFAAAPAECETIGVFTKSAGNIIAKASRAGADQMAKSLGVTIFHYIPTSPDNVPQQTFLVEEALRQKRDALVFTPVDVKAMVAPIQKVNAAGLPLVNVGDRLRQGRSRLLYRHGRLRDRAGDRALALFKAMDNKGNLIVLEGPPNLPTAIARQKGFQDALKEAPNIKVVLSKSANYARPVAIDLPARCSRRCPTSRSTACWRRTTPWRSARSRRSRRPRRSCR